MRKVFCFVILLLGATHVSLAQSSQPEAVDLGLSVKWADRNLGASSPEDYGAYYAWGETEPKSDFLWSTNKWGNAHNYLTKYCTDSFYGRNGFTDGKIILEPEDDAAHVALGGSWRMPTRSEFDELVNNCTWEWLRVNEVYGRKVTGPNGNSIFLPASGYRLDTKLKSAGSYGLYWSSSLYTDYPYCAWILRLHSSRFSVLETVSRNSGLPVRPITE